jgi:hypothetical protein
MKGRVRLFFIQNYISDGRLIRIKGKDSTEQYVPLVKQADTATYDVIVDDAPMSPNQKENTWLMMQQMMPMLAKLNVPPEIWQILIEYSPLPSSVSAKINQVLAQAAQQPPPPDPDMVKAQSQLQAKQLELQQKAEQQARQAEIDQQKQQAEFALERDKMANELEIEKAKLQIDVEKGRQEILQQSQKHNMEMQHESHKLALQNQQHQQTLQFQSQQSQQELAFQDQQQKNDLQFQDRKSIRETQAKAREKGIDLDDNAKPVKRKYKVNRDHTGRMTEIAEQ